MDQQQTIERPAAAANEEIEIDLLDGLGVRPLPEPAQPVDCVLH